MNMYNLHYFVVAVEEMNLSSAAKRLFISQQSLSKQIIKLEEECGTPLFVRTRGKGIAITEAGQCLYENAKEILDIYGRTEKQLQDIIDFQSNELAISITRVRAHFVLPSILEEYCSRYPNIHIRVSSGSSSYVAESVLSGEADVGIGIDINDENLDRYCLTRERQYVALHSSLLTKYYSPEERETMLSSQKLPLRVFARCPFVLCESDIWSGRYFQKLLATDPFNANILIKCNDFMVMYQMCRKGLGATIVSGSLLKYLEDDGSPDNLNGVFYFALDDSALNEESNMFLITRKNDYLSKPCKEFLRTVKKQFTPPLE